MKLEEHKDLWTRIRGFPVDDPDALIKFSDKLAFENNWSEGFTRRAIEEYKKFIFLCCISPTGASPSNVVDEVWHLHLTYTRNYWNEFCRQTLGKEIHHHPSKGGSAEKGKHQNWYAETIQLYSDVFGETPPIDIWPPANYVAPPGLIEDIQRPNYWPAYKKHLYILALPLLHPLLFGKLHPFALTGPQFLWFFAVMIITTIVYSNFVYRDKKKIVERLVDEFYDGHATSYQLARFVYGSNKAVQAAVVDLASNHILTANSWGRLNIYPSLYNSQRDRNNPLSSALHQEYEEGQRVKLKDITAYYNDEITFHQGLANLYIAVNKTDVYKIILMILLAVIGCARLMQGLANDKAVDYLGIILIVTGILVFIMGHMISAKTILQNIFVEKYRLKELDLPQQEKAPAQFVFLGLASMAGFYAVSNLETTFKNTGDYTSTTSSCGGSGCGSSCGGGGCGGCGGD